MLQIDHEGFVKFKVTHGADFPTKIVKSSDKSNFSRDKIVFPLICFPANDESPPCFAQ